MRVKLVTYTKGAEEVCMAAASMCTGSKNGERSLKQSLKSGHESVIEHAVFTFEINGLSRVALAQLTRHRIASFSVRSQRYVKLSNPELVLPESILASRYAAETQSTMRYCINLYERMVENGVPKEDARYVMPQAVATDLFLTMNARELRHFFSLRCCNRAQWEIRILADEMLKLCKQAAPELFMDAGPGCIKDNCLEQRPCGSPKRKDDRND